MLLGMQRALLVVVLGLISFAVTSCGRSTPTVGAGPAASPVGRPQLQLISSRLGFGTVPSPTPAGPADGSTQPAAGASAPTASPIQVFLDPGHGGVDTGAIGTSETGAVVYERDMTLALALRAAARLRADGIGVALSRSDASLPGAVASDYTSDGTLLTPQGVLADLQRRIDRANASGARVFLSIHLNGFSDPAVAGTQTFYDGARPFASQNLAVATLVQQSVISSLRARGYTTPDRGVMDDQNLQAESLGALSGSYNHLILLGPGIPGTLRPTTMPGALIEVLYLSNPPEATAIAQPAMQDLLGTAIAQGIEQYLRG